MRRARRSANVRLRAAAGRWLRNHGVLSAGGFASARRTYKFVAPSPPGERSPERATGELPLVPRAWRGDAASRELFFETGRKGLEELAAAIEAHTGVTLAGSDALDFGCGLGRFTVALAQRCRQVYGLDQSATALRDAERNAEYMKADNIAWMQAERLHELSGRYDVVLSVDVFQHIPARDGERIFTALLAGLRPGGAGAIELPLRPARALAQLFAFRAPVRGGALNPVRLARAWNVSRAYTLLNSYSLNRLGELLAAADVRLWHVRFRPRNPMRAYDSATVIFTKAAPPAPSRPAGAAVAGSQPLPEAQTMQA
jgi:2-polyprenyl-3-methyl-5-hydroxy-6-metoxy-1,4-benzoquinol methylase